MTGRASMCVTVSSVVNMLRFVVFVCCVVSTICVPNDFDLNCGRNAEMKCVQTCPPPRTCRNREIQYRCREPGPCRNECTCKPGYVRNAVGDCITNEECDMCKRENEYFACDSACDNECAKLGTQNRTHCPIKNIVCNRKCYCEDGFARNDKGDCIPVEQCHIKNVEGGSSKVAQEESRVRRSLSRYDLVDPVCSGENEVHTDCRKSCPPNTCLSLVARFKCDSEEPCRKGCLCKPGYLRQTPTSPCIPICQCEQMKHSADCKNTFLTK